MQAKGTATSAHAFNRLWDIAGSLSFLRAIEQSEPVDLDTEGATHALVECH